MLEFNTLFRHSKDVYPCGGGDTAAKANETFKLFAVRQVSATSHVNCHEYNCRLMYVEVVEDFRGFVSSREIALDPA